MDEPAPRGALNLDEIREIVRIVSEASISELEIEARDLKVAVRKTAHGAVAAHANHVPAASADTLAVPSAPPAASSAVPPAVAVPPAPADENAARWVPIVAPLVGTFYRTPSPDSAPFAKEGDWIAEGQTVCIIEAMKMFNEIHAEASGRVVRILAEHGMPVEYGQPLLLLDPTSGP
jgi:acetyl-CoA carboxylase biotin carboxyl carrier protein